MFVLSVVSAALLAGQASATAVHAIQGRSPAIERFIFARQNSGFNPASIPQQCQSICAGTSTVLSGQGCQTDACLCTSSINTGFQQCLNCILSLAPPDASLTQQSQEALEQYEDACASVGIPVASLTISGASSLPTSGRGSVSIPPNSGGASSPSIFFSTPNDIPSVTPTLPSSATGGAPNTLPPGSSPTRTVVTPGSTPTETPANGGNTGGGTSGNGAASGGERAYVMSGILGVGIVGGAMMVLGL